MITFKQKGNFSSTYRFLRRNKKLQLADLNKYGERGVAALRQATPKDTGKTAESWYYKIVEENGSIRIQFLNSNIVRGIPIAIILQTGHATGTGGYVEGQDYINPAIQPIFDEIAKYAWREVTTK